MDVSGLCAEFTNELSAPIRAANEVIHMSIEWLLTKIQKTEIQGRAAESACLTVDHPEEPYNTQPDGSNEHANGHQEHNHRTREHLTDYSADSKPYLRCRCGCGNPVPLPLSEKGKSRIIRFKCAGCGRRLQYNHRTRIIGKRKGILGFLLGRSR